MTALGLSFVLLPVIGIIFWAWIFPRLPLVRRLHKASSLDSHNFGPVAGTVTLKELRRGNDLGDRVVIVHFMIPFCDRLRDDAITAGIVGVMLTLLMTIVLGVGIVTHDPAAAALEGSAFLRYLLSQVLRYWLLPLGVVILLIRWIIRLELLRNEIQKLQQHLPE